MVEAAVLQDNTPAPCTDALRAMQFLQFVLSGEAALLTSAPFSAVRSILADADDTTTVDVAPSIGVS